MLLSCIHNWLTVFLWQTPEKKANDQRVRKRKADHFDSSQGKLAIVLWCGHVSLRPSVWTLCLSFPGKAGARGHKISDYFEVSCEPFFPSFLSVYQAQLMTSVMLQYWVHNLSYYFSNHLSAILVFPLNCFPLLLSLYLAVSLREVAVLVPALPGEYHQWSALPHSTPSPTPLSRWACFVCGLCHAF